MIPVNNSSWQEGVLFNRQLPKLLLNIHVVSDSEKKDLSK